MDIDDIAPGDEAPAAGASGAIDVRDIIRQVVDDATQRISRKNIDLRRRIARNIPGLVDGSCEQLYQALLDCASGASALAERGNVLIECAIDDQQDDRITLRFVISHDRGAIAQGDLARLLGPGCNAPVEEEPHGEDAECEARVSLATARRHIASLGGQLHVENDPAGGFRFWFLAKFTLGEFASSNRRQHVRLSQDSLTCNLGEIADISLGGMRIVSNKPYEGIVDIELTDDETTLSIRAEVVRCTRVKFRNHDIGLQFINLTADHRDSLSRISIRNRMRRTIRSEA